MINKKSKAVSVILLAVLMMFSLVLFTACGSSELENKVKDLENQIETLQNQQNQIVQQNQIAEQNEKALNLLTILSYGENGFKNSTYTVPNYGSTGMTEYKGIKQWTLNNVDFVEESSSRSYNFSIMTLSLALLQNGQINVNENYQECYMNNDYGYLSWDNMKMRVKIELSSNEMVVYTTTQYYKNSIQTLYGVGKTYVKFVETTIINVVCEYYESQQSNPFNVEYFSGGKIYSAFSKLNQNQSGTLATGLKSSLDSELTKETKSGSIDLKTLMQ